MKLQQKWINIAQWFIWQVAVLQQVSCTGVKCRQSGNRQTCFDAFTALAMIPSWYKLAKTGCFFSNCRSHPWMDVWRVRHQADVRDRLWPGEEGGCCSSFLWTPESFVCPSESSSRPRKQIKHDGRRRCLATGAERSRVVAAGSRRRGDSPPDCRLRPPLIFLFVHSFLNSATGKKMASSAQMSTRPHGLHAAPGVKPRFRIDSAEWNKCWMTRQK